MPHKVPELSEESKQRVHAILERAAKDINFREQLLKSPETALKGTDLTPEEVKAVSDLRRVGLEEWGVDVRKFRSFLRDNGNKVSALNLAIESVKPASHS